MKDRNDAEDRARWIVLIATAAATVALTLSLAQFAHAERVATATHAPRVNTTGAVAPSADHQTRRTP